MLKRLYLNLLEVYVYSIASVAGRLNTSRHIKKHKQYLQRKSLKEILQFLCSKGTFIMRTRARRSLFAPKKSASASESIRERSESSYTL